MEIDDFVTFFGDLSDNTGGALDDVAYATLLQLRAYAQSLISAVEEVLAERDGENGGVLCVTLCILTSPKHDDKEDCYGTFTKRMDPAESRRGCGASAGTGAS